MKFHIKTIIFAFNISDKFVFEYVQFWMKYFVLNLGRIKQ